ncbi:serine/threonine-protein phosphatase 6 regulatory ankyrin repeat subunit B-like [Schistocerca piceifrons]|uniref:serine/threonine-protein phosphatase 6 regulatory ankyrin repeat subunit B-like n=1 Tax=Schistocerca piceifrons TaxID=274613 RepID=UPI001F5EB829|nr:serine/threonine-protein phosphatase 6 regulatory ankyrin repeat subunit B-like [Schistocerca piceifrons]
MFLTLALCFLQWVESVLAEQREARAPGGLSALHVAAAVGHPEVVQLLSRGLAVHGQDACGWTPLLYAAACADAGRRRHTVLALLEAGADAGYEAPSGDSALSLAALARRLDVVTDLAEPMLLYKPQNGWTYLHWAIHSRNVQVIRALIAAGHKVSTKDKQGSTALHLAAEEFYVEGARILLEAGAKIEKKDKSDHTALVLAAQRGQGEMVKCLMGHKPDLKKTNFISWTALHYAARNGPPEVVKYLIDQGADVNVRDLNGWKPIHVAARYSDDEVVAALLSGGADRTETLPHVASPLRLAVVAAQPRSVRRLLAAGAGPADDCLLALATSDDCNDVDDAARPEVARILLAAGARADPATAQEARKRGFALLAATIEAAAR